MIDVPAVYPLLRFQPFSTLNFFEVLCEVLLFEILWSLTISMHHVKLSSRYSKHQVIKLHGYTKTKYTREHIWEFYTIKTRLLSINETCQSSQRIAVIVSESSTPPLKIHLPRKNFTVTTNYKLWIACRIILLKLSCGCYVCSSVPHHS